MNAYSRADYAGLGVDRQRQAILGQLGQIMPGYATRGLARPRHARLGYGGLCWARLVGTNLG